MREVRSFTSSYGMWRQEKQRLLERVFDGGGCLYQAEVNLVDEAGAKLPSVALDDFATVISGAVIEF